MVAVLSFNEIAVFEEFSAGMIEDGIAFSEGVTGRVDGASSFVVDESANSTREKRGKGCGIG